MLDKNDIASISILAATTIFLVIILATFSPGRKEAQETVKTTNEAIDVDILFEQDGVKVYRFRDAGRWHYYADARGHVSTTVRSGKATTTEDVPTAQ